MQWQVGCFTLLKIDLLLNINSCFTLPVTLAKYSLYIAFITNAEIIKKRTQPALARMKGKRVHELVQPLEIISVEILQNKQKIELLYDTAT